eukprot:9828785-Heterocapsa_arctica.AAC.1
MSPRRSPSYPRPSWASCASARSPWGRPAFDKDRCPKPWQEHDVTLSLWELNVHRAASTSDLNN